MPLHRKSMIKYLEMKSCKDSKVMKQVGERAET